MCLEPYHHHISMDGCGIRTMSGGRRHLLPHANRVKGKQTIVLTFNRRHHRASLPTTVFLKTCFSLYFRPHSLDAVPYSLLVRISKINWIQTVAWAKRMAATNSKRPGVITYLRRNQLDIPWWWPAFGRLMEQDWLKTQAIESTLSHSHTLGRNQIWL